MIRRSLTLTLLCLIGTLSLQAAPPPLTLPAKVSGPAGSFVAITAETTGKTVRWLSLDKGLHLFPPDLLKDTHTAVVCSSNPGTYRLLAVTAIADEVSNPVICCVVIEGATPGPTPSPTPPPAPAPQPTAKAAWAIVILDNTARTVDQAQMLGSQELLTGLKQRDITLRVLDVTDPLVKENGYDASLAAGVGPPLLLVFDQAGKKIKIVRLPPDAKSFLAEFPQPAKASGACGPNGCPYCPNGAFIYPEFSR